MDFVGRARLRPGEGFAVPPGIGRFAARATIESSARPVAWRGIETRRVPTTFGELCVRVGAGSGPDAPAVALVHGVIVSSRYLVPMAAELAGELSVVVPDLPGYGLSERPPAVPTLPDLADAVVEVMRATGHERFAVLGNSFGAQIAVEAAIRHPANVERLVLVGPTVDPAARGLLRQYVRWQRNAPDEHLAVLPVMARDVLDIGPRAAAVLLRRMLDHRVQERLPLVRGPALVVRGGRDRVAPQRWAREAAELLPEGRLHVIPGYAHMPHWSGPSVTAQAVRGFLVDGS